MQVSAQLSDIASIDDDRESELYGDVSANA